VASTEVWFSMGAVFVSVTEDSEAIMSISKRNENENGERMLCVIL
jgi:hypothetical protein